MSAPAVEADWSRYGPSKERLIWIALKPELHAAKVRIVGFSVQTYVHGCEVNISPGALDWVRGDKARRPANADDLVDRRD
jgi:hypothetical protein